MQLSYADGFKESAARAARLERAGLDVAWVAEAYGFDGVSFMGYLAALTDRLKIASGVLPLFTRTPTLLAMTAAGIDALSDGRFILGIGASGPQVVEGFHGIPYDRPLGRTRETIEICRKAWARQAPLTHEGSTYRLPLPDGQGTGLGRPLKMLTTPVRSEIPVYIASLGDKNVELTAEIASGWLPLYFMPERAKEVFGAALAAGHAKRSTDLPPLEICAGGWLCIGEGAETKAVLDARRPMYALYIGGMGAKGRNFYNTLVTRYGFEKEAAEIQDLFLAGRRREAEAKVPLDLLEATNLVGPEAYVKERIAAYREAGVTMLNVTPQGDNPLELIEKVKSWAST